MRPRADGSWFGFGGLVVALVLAGALPAQMQWRFAPATGPFGRTEAAFAYDMARARGLLFGGQRGLALFSDTWEWDGSRWTLTNPSTRPAPRMGHSMAYDVARRRVVLFGGRDGATTLGDTWEWDGTTWHLRKPLSSPLPRMQHAMAYDVVRGRVVLFGGYPSFGDTWEWDGSTWYQRRPTGAPRARCGHGLAYDAEGRRVVLFGGEDARTNSMLADTWSWDGAAWVRLTTPRVPTPRAQHALCYDVARSRVVLFGGRDAADRVAGDTWEWDGHTWTRASPTMPPPGREGHCAVYDVVRREVVVFGGADSHRVVLGDTHGYAPTNRGTVLRFGEGCTGTGGVPAVGSGAVPIIGNRDFRVQFAAMRPRALTFLLASAQRSDVRLGACVLHPRLPFDVVLAGSSDAAGEWVVALPIPWSRALSGQLAFVQAGAVDPNGALLGRISLSPGLRVSVGD